MKKANGDVGKNVVIGGGLLGGGLIIGGVYWIFMGKNILGTHLGAVIGISVSVVMFGTILAGVLLGMAINRSTFLRIIVFLTVGAVYYYIVFSKQVHVLWIFPLLIINYIFGLILENYLGLEYFSLYNLRSGTVLFNIVTFTILVNDRCGILPPIGGAYLGTILGGAWAYKHLAMQ